MSEHKSHIDDNFVPEGLEFREEYLHAALSSYRRRKRAIFWRRTGIAALAILIIGSVYLAPWNEPDIQSANETQSPASPKIDQQTNTNDTSSTLDLDMDEGFLSKDRLTAADETPGASQEKSKQAVDMGDPMSSGVGLPVQLSTSPPNIIAKTSQQRKIQAESTFKAENPVSNLSNFEDQSSTAYSGSEQQSERFELPSALPYIACGVLSSDHELIHGKAIPMIPIRKWTFHAMIGAKLWANYSFGSGTRKLDPMLNLGVEYRWRKRMGLFVNAQLFTVSGVAEPYVAKQRQYDQGYRETTFSYHTDRFFYTGLSIGCNYRISRAHSIGVLYDFNYLLTTDNRITTGNSSSFEGATSFEEKAKGYVNGFRPFQHSLGFVYEFAMGKNKSIGTSYRIGLSDVTRNEYFGNEFHRNSLLALHLKIKLK
jgi:hypothetical protein